MYVEVCNVMPNVYLFLGTAVIGLHAVADSLPLCVCMYVCSSSMC